MENLKKDREIRKTWSMIKKRKRSSEILGVKMEIFPKNLIQKSWSAKKNSVPPKLGARSPPMLKKNLAVLMKMFRTLPRAPPYPSRSQVVR